MKTGSAVVGLHIVALCAFALTQGCVTTESRGSGRGAGAQHKRPFRHEHKGKAAPVQYIAQTDPYNTGGSSMEGSLVEEPLIAETSAPPLVEPVPSHSEQTTDIYIVQKGDMLSQLAVDFDTTTATLVQMNGLSNPDVLYVGQELRVPAGRRKSSSRSTTSKSSSIKKGGSYTIQKGDTLSGIALAAGVSINDLRKLNGIQGDKIMAGETISIPSYGKVPSKTHKVSSMPKKAESTAAPAVEPAPEVAAPASAPMMDLAAPAVTPDASGTTTTYDVLQDHVVYPGETLDDISRQYGVTKAEIMRLNNISDETQIRDGQTLRIPVAE